MHLLNVTVFSVDNDNEIANIALEVVSNDCWKACVVLCQGVQPFKKTFYAVFSFEMVREVILLGFGNYKVCTWCPVSCMHSFNFNMCTGGLSSLYLTPNSLQLASKVDRPAVAPHLLYFCFLF